MSRPAHPTRSRPAPVGGLIDQSAVHPDAAARRQALQALARRGGPRVAAALTAALRDPAPEVRRTAVEALASGRAGRWDDVAPYLRVLARTDGSPEVREAALDALTGVTRAA